MNQDNEQLLSLMMQIVRLSHGQTIQRCVENVQRYVEHYAAEAERQMEHERQRWEEYQMNRGAQDACGPCPGGFDGRGGMFGGFGGQGFFGGYSYSKGRVLRVLYHQPGMLQHEIAEALDIKPSSLSELITKLLAEDMICKQQDETDKRAFRIFLTDAGRQKAEELEKAYDGQTNSIFSCLTEEERNTLMQLLEKVISGGSQQTKQ
jgi:DNA-binding MarR family transcriptional regulator